MRVSIVVGVLLSIASVGGPGAVWAASPGDVDPVAEIGHTRWTSTNSIRLLSGPVESWEARLRLVESAEHHIHITTFSWHDDHYGRLFREKLVNLIYLRRQTNPDFTVHCLVDATARGVFDVSFRKLVEAGATVRSFNPNSWGIGPLYDARMHDKMIIVDGRRAIVGGRNIADEYYDPLKWWLDFGVEIEGDAVWDLQMLFLKSWETSSYLNNPVRFPVAPEALRQRLRTFWATGRFPNGRSPLEPYMNAGYFPPVEVSPGETELAVLYDNPILRRTAPTTDLLIELVEGAIAEIDLMSPFPNFPPELTKVLSEAEARGVQIRLFVNGPEASLRGGPFLIAGLPSVIELIESGVDVWAWAGNGHLDRLVEEVGCEPEIMPPTALHGKLVRIDDEITIVHSSNFNIRSTYYNTEAGVVVRDREFNRIVKDLLNGLISLQDLAVACGAELDPLTVDRVVGRLGPGDLPKLREMLGKKQGFIDSMGLLW